MDNRQAVCDEQRAQQQENAMNALEPEREDTCRTIYDAFVSKEQPASFEHELVALDE